MRKYSIKKNFYVNQKEDDLLKLKSEKSGMSESEFLRSCIEGYKIKEQPSDVILNFLNQIRGISNNVNQIAKVANATRSITYKDVENINNIISQFIKEFEKKVYSRGDDFDGNN